MLFVHNDIPSNMISIKKLSAESFFIELNLKIKR